MEQGKGVVASSLLVLKKSGIRILLQVGACKLGGHILLLVGFKELMELVLPSGWCM
jgi:hypothetical protein